MEERESARQGGRNETKIKYMRKQKDRHSEREEQTVRKKNIHKDIYKS